MECLVQWLDELEDLIYAVALKAERIRQAVLFFLFMSAAVALQCLGVVVALRNPQLANVVAGILLVGLIVYTMLADPRKPCAAT